VSGSPTTRGASAGCRQPCFQSVVLIEHERGATITGAAVARETGRRQRPRTVQRREQRNRFGAAPTVGGLHDNSDDRCQHGCFLAMLTTVPLTSFHLCRKLKKRA